MSPNTHRCTPLRTRRVFAWRNAHTDRAGHRGTPFCALKKTMIAWVVAPRSFKETGEAYFCMIVPSFRRCSVHALLQMSVLTECCIAGCAEKINTCRHGDFRTPQNRHSCEACTHRFGTLPNMQKYGSTTKQNRGRSECVPDRASAKTLAIA